MFKRTIRLDPIPPAWILHALGESYFGAEQYEDALAMYKQLYECSKKGEYNIRWAHFFLAPVYAMLEQEEKARNHVSEYLKINPKYSIKHSPRAFEYKNQADIDRIINALWKAGFPE